MTAVGPESGQGCSGVGVPGERIPRPENQNLMNRFHGGVRLV